MAWRGPRRFLSHEQIDHAVGQLLAVVRPTTLVWNNCSQLSYGSCSTAALFKP
jgi:hypothetical protein